MKEIFKYAFILGVICLVSSGLLAVVNALTESSIKLTKDREEKQALSELMPESMDFKPRFEEGKIVYYAAFDKSNKLNGFVIKAQARGYSSDIELMAGVDLDLQITNIKVVSQNETPGLGTRITEAPFLEKFKGRDSSSLAGVEAITGATISSSAVINGLKNKIDPLKERLLSEK